MSADDLDALRGALLSAVVPGAAVSRVLVVPECASTQDIARRDPSGPGLVVVAGRQTGGRGRLGRRWADTGQEGVAATLVLESRRLDPGVLSLLAGLAAWRSVRAFVPTGVQLGVRWPNDVVERDAVRKVAGVLIEVADGRALVGIGINVSQAVWPEELAGRAVSLAQLGSKAPRSEAAAGLVREFNRTLSQHGAGETERLVREWAECDVLIGTRRRFVHGGVEYAGVVVKVDPTNAITLTDDSRGTVCLPALTTSLVHEEPGESGAFC